MMVIRTSPKKTNAIGRGVVVVERFGGNVCGEEKKMVKNKI
jgi:hypothetical protein